MNTPFQITAPGLYKTRDGRKAQIHFNVNAEPHRPWVGELSGRVEQWRNDGGATPHGTLHPSDLIAPWTEPRRRPFTQAEVMKLPADAYIRMCIGGAYLKILGTDFESIGYHDTMGWHKVYLKELDAAWQYTLDGGITWLPFWKEEP